MKRGLIEIEHMEFYAAHGCFAEERTIGNPFIVSLSLEVDIEKACQTDQILDTVNYQTAFNIVKDQILIPSNILEHVAHRIINALYDQLPGILHAKLKISKINPPMGGQIERVSLTIEQ